MLIPFVPVAYAQLSLPGVVNPVSTGPLALAFVCTIVFKWVFTGAIILSVILALVAAYKYMTSAGDPGKIKSANNTLLFVAIGIAVAILARSVPVIVGSFVASGLNLDPCGSNTATTTVSGT